MATGPLRMLQEDFSLNFSLVLTFKMLVNWKLIHFLQELTIWAYPKTPGEHKDALVCCIKDNPEPVTYDIKCVGVNPQIQLDRKTIQFEKVWRFNACTLVF